MQKAIRQKVQKIDLQSHAFKQAPESTWQSLSQQNPIVTTRQPLLGRIALTTRYDESQTLLRSPELFTLDARRCGHKAAAGMRWWVPSVFKPLANNLLTLDGEEHRALRKRVDYAFRRTQIADLQTHIDAFANRAIENLRTQLHTDGSADFIEHVARPVPQWVISHILGLDVSPTSSDNSLNRALSTLGTVQRATDIFRVLPAIKLISKTLSTEIEQRRREPREDLISALVSEHGEGRPLDNDELLAMAFLLYVAGHETTTHLLSTSLWSIITNPAIEEQIQSPLEDRSIHEFIRFNSPVQMSKPRFVVRDMEFSGALLRRGDTIAVLVGAANHDTRVFDNPHTFNLSQATPKHLGFGTGPHSCFGMHLAIRETTTILNKIIQETPLTLNQNSHPYRWSRRLGLRSLKHLIVMQRK